MLYFLSQLESSNWQLQHGSRTHNTAYTRITMITKSKQNRQSDCFVRVRSLDRRRRYNRRSSRSMSSTITQSAMGVLVHPSYRSLTYLVSPPPASSWNASQLPARANHGGVCSDSSESALSSAKTHIWWWIPRSFSSLTRPVFAHLSALYVCTSLKQTCFQVRALPACLL